MKENEQHSPQQLNHFERLIKTLGSEKSPVFAQALARFIFRSATLLGYEVSSAKNRTPEEQNKLAQAMAEALGEHFLKEIGGIRKYKALTFDYKTAGFPLTVQAVEGAQAAPVLWSRQVQWAQKKYPDINLLTQQEQHEVLVILQIYAKLMEYGLSFE